MELKPCPLCGSNIKYPARHPAGHDVSFKIECACGVSYSAMCADEESLIRVWNRRAAGAVVGYVHPSVVNDLKAKGKENWPWIAPISSHRSQFDGVTVALYALEQPPEDLRDALLAEFNDAAIADRVMRVIKEQRA